MTPLVEFVPTPTRAQRTIRLFERVQAGGRVDRERDIIFGVKVIGRTSKNGREYTEAALRGAVPMYEGVQVFIDHDDDRRSGSSTRKTADLFGSLRSVRFEEGAVRADLHFLKSHPLAGQIMEAAERQPHLLGLSHHAEGNVARRGGKLIVESIGRVHSVDIVTRPATNAGLFEQADLDGPGSILSALETSFDEAMTDLTAAIRAGSPDAKMAPFINATEAIRARLFADLRKAVAKIVPDTMQGGTGDGETAKPDAVEPPEGPRPGSRDTQESYRHHLHRQVFGGGKPAPTASPSAGSYDDLREAVFGKPH